MPPKTTIIKPSADALNRSEVLYMLLNVGVVRTPNDVRMARLALAPISQFPKCDWCEGPNIIPHADRGPVVPYGRWVFHRACYPNALRQAPSTTRLAQFTGWLTLPEWGQLCGRLRARGYDIADILAGRNPLYHNELQEIGEASNVPERHCARRGSTRSLTEAFRYYAP